MNLLGIMITLLGACLSALLVGFATWFSNRLDIKSHPGPRQSHAQSTPTGGGLGMMSALAVILWVLFALGEIGARWVFAVVPSFMLLSLLGWFDDRRPLSVLLRLTVQLLVSLVLIGSLKDWNGIHGFSQVVMGAVALTGVMNMYNFMDGSHGMAGLEGLFIAGVIAIAALSAEQLPLAYVALAVAACCIGFLPWNIPRPRVFMGDAGSVPLGLVLAWLLVLAMEQATLSLPMVILVFSVFLIDSGLTLSARVIRGERWYTPHNLHVYQKLIKSGWTHGQVACVYQLTNIFLVLPSLLLAKVFPNFSWAIVTGVLTIMACGWFVAARATGDLE